MPPASGRRRARKEADPPASDADMAETVSTPSRKRRRINGTDNGTTNASSTTAIAPAAPTAVVAPGSGRRSTRRRESAESDETVEHAAGDTEAEELLQFSLADEVIRHLMTATYNVMASIDYDNNIVDKRAQAFAKIAGRTWTYYVSSLSVILGRPNSKGGRDSGASITPGSGPVVLEDLKVDIDLGPDMQVSRFHAQIAFDGDAEAWFIFVNGRNGLVLDDRRLDAGQREWLKSGMVINILGTQMMFLLPNSPPTIHPEIMKLLLLEEDEESEAETKDEKPAVRSFAGRGGRGRASNAYQNSNPRQQAQTASRTHHHHLATTAATAAAAAATAPIVSSGSQAQPGTPVGKSKDPGQPRSKPSPAYSRGVMMESTEEIDYSADSAKDIKPPHSYASMIGQAILSTPEANATLAKIYEYIKEHYAFFRFNGGGWQNSIRHNLSLSKCFEKIPRRTDEPGKGMKWQIVLEHREEFLKKNIQPTRRIRQFASSGPNSPANNMGAVAQTERLMGVIGTEPSSQTRSRKRSRSTTPPLTSYPVASESYTPDRASRTSFLHTSNLPTTNGNNTLDSANSEGFTPTYDRSGAHFRAPVLSNTAPTTNAVAEALIGAALNSPPTLTSSAYDAGPGVHLFTPLVPRQKPSLVAQSTCKAPSFYAKELFSSPAPFWKYVDIGSTPAKLPDLSPYKGSKEDEDEDEEEEEEDDDDDDARNDTGPNKDEDGEDNNGRGEKSGEDVPHPSSPPVLDAGGGSSVGEDPDVSPSRTVSRPVSRRDGGAGNSNIFDIKLAPDMAKDGNAATTTPTKKAPAKVQSTTPIGRPPPQTKSTTPVGYPQLPSMLNLGNSVLGPALNPYAMGKAADDDDGEEIDLARGFEKIGSFHRTIHATNALTR